MTAMPVVIVEPISQMQRDVRIEGAVVKTFVAYPSRPVIVFFILTNLAFLTLGLWNIGAFGEFPDWYGEPPAILIVGSWIMVFMFIWIVAELIRQLFDDGERLRIGPEGVRSSLWSMQTIPWSEVIDITTYKVRSSKFIVLHLRDPARFPRSGSAFKRWISRLDRLAIKGDISISLNGTDRRFAEALSAMEYFRLKNSQKST